MFDDLPKTSKVNKFVSNKNIVVINLQFFLQNTHQVFRITVCSFQTHHSPCPSSFYFATNFINKICLNIITFIKRKISISGNTQQIHRKYFDISIKSIDLPLNNSLNRHKKYFIFSFYFIKAGQILGHLHKRNFFCCFSVTIAFVVILRNNSKNKHLIAQNGEGVMAIKNHWRKHRKDSFAEIKFCFFLFCIFQIPYLNNTQLIFLKFFCNSIKNLVLLFHKILRFV